MCHGANLKSSGTNDLVCDIGNPLKGGKKVRARLNSELEFDRFVGLEQVDLIIIMEPARVISATTPNYLFLMNVTSANAENNQTLNNNQYEIGIPLKVEVDLVTHGHSNPERDTYNYSTLYTEEDVLVTPQSLEDIGREVNHTYNLRNNGPTTIKKAEVTILWPTRDLKGNFLLYLVDQVHIGGRRNKGFCRTITRDDMNPLGLRVCTWNSILETYSIFIYFPVKIV